MTLGATLAVFSYLPGPTVVAAARSPFVLAFAVLIVVVLMVGLVVAVAAQSGLRPRRVVRPPIAEPWRGRGFSGAFGGFGGSGGSAA